MTTCTWYLPWSKVVPDDNLGSLPIAECFRYDYIGCKCLILDVTCPRPWPVHVVKPLREEEKP